uniref:Uncharacterized protein n=1 Tax=Angiostrongylus cantonensis TaxID=6313 RepID=A0A0K0D0F2_ANGCA
MTRHDFSSHFNRLKDSPDIFAYLPLLSAAGSDPTQILRVGMIRLYQTMMQYLLLYLALVTGSSAILFGGGGGCGCAPPPPPCCPPPLQLPSFSLPQPCCPPPCPAPSCGGGGAPPPPLYAAAPANAYAVPGK